MKTIKIWTLTCADCAMIELHQPCEACPNQYAQGFKTCCN